MRHAILAITAVLFVAATAACGGGKSESTPPAAAPSGASPSTLPQGSEPFTLDPAEFTTEIDNPYWPMKPGSHWVYRETNADGDVQHIDVTVTDRTKTIMGIEAVVVHDVVTQGGQVTEDTFDWYAQDADGNVWYLGEDTKEYENGKLKTTEGSWRRASTALSPGLSSLPIPSPGSPTARSTTRTTLRTAPRWSP